MERDADIAVAAVIQESKPVGPHASGTPLLGALHCWHPQKIWSKIYFNKKLCLKIDLISFELDIIQHHRSGSYAVAGYTLGLAMCLLTYTAYIMQV